MVLVFLNYGTYIMFIVDFCPWPLEECAKELTAYSSICLIATITVYCI